MFIGICILSFIRISLSVHPHFRMRMPLCELQIRFSLLPNYKFGRTGEYFSFEYMFFSYIRILEQKGIVNMFYLYNFS